FAATFFAGAFLATAFFAGAFLAATFLAGAFFATTFFAGAFLAATFFAGAFFAAAFLAVAFFAVAIAFSLIKLQRALQPVGWPVKRFKDLQSGGCIHARPQGPDSGFGPALV